MQSSNLTLSLVPSGDLSQIESDDIKSVLISKKHSPSEWLKLGIDVNNDGIVRNAYELLSYPKMNTEKVFELCGFKNNSISRRAKEHILFNAMYEKYIVMLKSYHSKRNESLAEYYYRTNKHLIGKIIVAEYDPDNNKMLFKYLALLTLQTHPILSSILSL